MNNTDRRLSVALIVVALISTVATTMIANASMRDRFISVMSHEAESLLALTNSYVSTYTRYRSLHRGDDFPVPATFRADAIEHFNQTDDGRQVKAKMVGLPEQWIKTPPSGALLENQIRTLLAKSKIDSYSELVAIGDDKVLRSLFPSVASSQGCVDCHNRLQQLSEPYELGDIMGFYIVDRTVSAELRSIFISSAWYGILLGIAILACAAVLKYWKRQRKYASQLEKIAYSDSLTGCMTRRALFDKVNELSSSCRGSLLMLDIDHFKTINDKYGHAAGDAVLEQFGLTLKRCVRESDWVARVGGEEFLVWLNGTDYKWAMQIGERIRRETESLTVRIDQGSIRFTVSIGVLTVRQKDPFDFSFWMKVVDRLLYLSKSQGRNRLSGRDGCDSQQPSESEVASAA